IFRKTINGKRLPETGATLTFAKSGGSPRRTISHASRRETWKIVLLGYGVLPRRNLLHPFLDQEEERRNAGK
ncbi:hypothetical protein, partial [Akkermansia sp.]|uniref:hypothetical protein n=1 Tax=Akkermansia sp. TaxID=1872421 RepID=UPI003AAF354F